MTMKNETVIQDYYVFQNKIKPNLLGTIASVILQIQEISCSSVRSANPSLLTTSIRKFLGTN